MSNAATGNRNGSIAADCIEPALSDASFGPEDEERQISADTLEPSVGGIGQQLRALVLANLQRAACAGLVDATLHAAIHQTRKCIRVARSALALAAKVLGPRAISLGAELARIGRSLSALRDSQVLVETLQGLRSDSASELRQVLPSATRRACRRRDELTTRALLRDPTFALRRRRLLRVALQLDALDWSALTLADLGQAVLLSKRRIGKASRCLKRALKSDLAWHTLRRRLRRLRQQESLLRAVQPGACAKTPGLAQRSDSLGESQDAVMLRRNCGAASPFTARQRAMLKVAAQLRLARLRSVLGAADAMAADVA